MAETVVSKQFHSKAITIKLDGSNYNTWKKAVLFVIIGNGLESYIDDSDPPSEFLVQADGSQTKNPAFVEHRQVDAALASWLFSCVDPSFLSKLANCTSSREIWTTLKPKSSATTNLRLLTALNTQKKGDLTMQQYLGKIQDICDSLNSSNHKVTVDMHIAAILAGLGPEYDSNVALIAGSRVPYDLESASNVLYDAEVRLNESVAKFGALNITTTALNASVGTKTGSSSGSSTSSHSPENSGSSRSDLSSQPRRAGNQVGSQAQGQAMGYNRGRSRIQCQLCGLFGHLAGRCWHRPNPNYQGVGSQSHNSYRGYSAPPPRSSYHPPPSNYYPGANSAEFVRSPPPHYPDYYSHPPPSYHYESPPHSSSSSSSAPPGSVFSDDAQSQVFHTTASAMVNKTPSAGSRHHEVDHSAWYPDSGATNHLTNSPHTMSQSSPYNGTGFKHAGGSSRRN